MMKTLSSLFIFLMVRYVDSTQFNLSKNLYIQIFFHELQKNVYKATYSQDINERKFSVQQNRLQV